MIIRAISSVGRAARLHREGRGFKSLIAHRRNLSRLLGGFRFYRWAMSKALSCFAWGLEKNLYIFSIPNEKIQILGQVALMSAAN